MPADAPGVTATRIHHAIVVGAIYQQISDDYLARSGTQFITNNLQQTQISFSFAQPVRFEGVVLARCFAQRATCGSTSTTHRT